MNKDELKTLFDQQAVNYDQQWQKMSPINTGLHFFLNTIFAKLPQHAHFLCIGVGTGKELIYLAQQFPDWHFTAVEPSSQMLNVCRQEVEKAGFSTRCTFHEGYLETLELEQRYDAASCLLVSHFILNVDERIAFFKQIADKLKPHGLLVSSDLAFDKQSASYDDSLNLWLSIMSMAEVSNDEINKIKAAYNNDVAVLAPTQVANIIETGGFDSPLQFYQAGMIHAFLAKRAN
ncbi:class I SAM-dependent methyltransferase [Pseudoalteromonas prydzensis]|uniref:class I SAM-dependent methyltransferase n=1 Tax=Pseudoalteromonas prydzensis TaxID=182141 RepID=UPI0007E4EFC0|nr:class I SAM-dependent methyltransferase [Pseudoalteromonas prydzensis]MBE0378184.1 tRNA (cmo5U34)-methyltransferase [Pseudoalteromonas prydzensis ACAM 620]